MCTTEIYKYRSRQAIGLHGFTLVEVLVALAITAVGLLAAFRATGLATQEHAWLRARTLGAWVAQNRLAEIQINPAAQLTIGSGEVTQASEAYRWTQRVENTFSPRFRRVEVSVARGSDPGYAVATAVGYVDTRSVR
jgi:general secretion pathway protein I